MFLAEIADKLPSISLIWAIALLSSLGVGVMAYCSRVWIALVPAILLTLIGFAFSLSFLDDPVFGNAAVRELGWSWMGGNLLASTLPPAAVVVGARAAGATGRRTRRLVLRPIHTQKTS